MFLYNFFDYKHHIENFASDMFSIPHIIYIILAYISVLLILIFCKNIKKKTVENYIKVLSVLMPIFEITKISWESFWDIKEGYGLNLEGLIPIYTCSLFIYMLLFAAWSKNDKIKRMSLSFLSTIGFFAGGIGVIACNGLNFYPFFTFGAFYSLIFHYLMFFTGAFLLGSRYVSLDWSDIYISWIPIVILSFLAVPINYILGSDYMQTYSASGVPLMESLASICAKYNIRFVFTLVMICAYLVLSTIVVSIYKLVYKIKEKKGATI